jgi:hypothetical protein
MAENENFRVRLAALADVAQLTPMRSALWPEFSASHHAAELTAVLNGSSQRVYPLKIFVAEENDGTLAGFLEANLRSAADGCDEKLPVGYVEGWFVAVKASAPRFFTPPKIGRAPKAARKWPPTPTSPTPSPSAYTRPPVSPSPPAASFFANASNLTSRAGSLPTHFHPDP